VASGAGAQAPGLEIGSEFAGHRIVAVLGRGGMGVVYRARKLALDRDRALKVIAPALSNNPRFRERFKRESRMAAAIEHPNVIPVHDAGEEGGMLYLAMRLVEGSDLHRVVTGRGRLAPERASRIITGVAAALDAAHTAGLVHRDVKPANVLIESRDRGEHVYLSDFGITRTTLGGDTLTGTGEFIGSVDYIAPEQAAGESVDGRTDLYSLGGVAHFALTGRPPFPRDTQLATLFAHANAPRPRPTETDPTLPSDVDAVIIKAMAADPGDRYASAGEFAADLARALGVAPGPLAAGTPPLAPPPTPPAETRLLEPARRPWRLMLAVALGVAALAATAAAVILATGDGDPEPETGGNRASPQPPVDAPKPKVLETIDVGSAPLGLSVGEEEKVWVAEPEAGRVEGIDTTIEQVVPPSADAPSAASVAVGFGSIWAVSPGEDALYRLDPAEGLPPKPIPVGNQPSDVAIDENGLWVSNEGSDDVMRVDPVTEAVDATEQVGAGAAPRSIATGGGSVWVANIEGQNVVELDSRTGKRVGRAVAVGSRPSDLAYGEDGVWVVDFFDGTLARISPRNQEIRDDPIDVGDKPRGVKIGFGYVWIAHGGAGTVSVVDPAAEEVVAEVKVGKDPADIAVGEGSVWTADQADSTVTRIEP
jgi:YVTN family beta-propeller protein